MRAHQLLLLIGNLVALANLKTSSFLLCMNLSILFLPRVGSPYFLCLFFVVASTAIFKVIELDNQSDGSEIQAALGEWAGERIVPNVFFGGCESTVALNK